MNNQGRTLKLDLEACSGVILTQADTVWPLLVRHAAFVHDQWLEART